MRLVWVIIPLILIVSMIGVVGVQESFSQCLQNEDFPHAPCLDEITVAWYEHIPQEPFELQKAKEASFGSEWIKFRLLGVEDSRCPSDVQCVWEGQVTVTVEVNADRETLGNYTISLNESLDGSLIHLDGYSLQLLKVEPYPTSNEPIHVSNYVATMKFVTNIQESFAEESIWGFFTIHGGKIISIEDHIKASSVTLQTEMYEDGYLITPRLDHISTKSDCTINYNDFFVLIDNEEGELEINKEEENMKIKIPKNSKNVEVIVSSVATPHTLSTAFAQFCKNLDEGKYLSPLKQMKVGFIARDIICKDNLQLIFKSSGNSPACVTPSTAEKLIQRGWTS